MAITKMAIPSGDSTSMLYTTVKVTRKIYHALTFLDRISDESLDTFVGLCAGHSAIVRIQRARASKLFKRLAATPTPNLDNECWAAEVGGDIIGEVEGHRSHLTPWKAANFGIRFLYRRAADAEVSSQELERPVYPHHDGTLYSWLLNSKISASYQAIHSENSVRDSIPSSLKLSRTSSSITASYPTSMQVSRLQTAAGSLPRLSPLVVITPMTPPTSPTAGDHTKACDEIPDMRDFSQHQVLISRPKPLLPSAALLAQLFSEEQDNALNCRKRAARNQANLKMYSNQIYDSHSIADTIDDTESCVGSFEVAAMRRQQNRRLQRKILVPPIEFEDNAARKPNKVQTRVVKGGVATRSRIQFRERESTRRKAATRALENNAI